MADLAEIETAVLRRFQGLGLGRNFFQLAELHHAVK